MVCRVLVPQKDRDKKLQNKSKKNKYFLHNFFLLTIVLLTVLLKLTKEEVNTEFTPECK